MSRFGNLDKYQIYYSKSALEENRSNLINTVRLCYCVGKAKYKISEKITIDHPY